MRLGVFAFISEVPYDLLLLENLGYAGAECVYHPVPWNFDVNGHRLDRKEYRSGMAPYRQMGVIAATALLPGFCGMRLRCRRIMLIAVLFWLRLHRVRHACWDCFFWRQPSQTGLSAGLAAAFA